MNGTKFTSPTFLAVACSVLMPFSSSAIASASVEEVIVTAQKRDESQQSIPIAITAISSSSLEKQGIVDFAGIAAKSPSMSMTPFPGQPDTLILVMRGQGVTDPSQITSDGSVGLYEDGFYISRPQGATFDLADVEHVELLRGPQGTLYGRNTTGGAVNIISKKPTGEFGFKQDLSYGSRDYFRSLTSINLPRIADVATKLTILKSQQDGYVTNPGSSNDFGESHRFAGRLAFSWQPIDRFEASYFVESGTMQSTGVYYQNPLIQEQNLLPGLGYIGDRPVSKAYRAFDLPLTTTRFEGHGLTLSWELADNLTIKSLTGYRKLHYDGRGDFADSIVVGNYPADASGPSVVNNHQFSEELQLIGDAFDDRINYLLGAFYYREGGSHDTSVHQYTVPPNAGLIDVVQNTFLTADAKSQAVYGQVTWKPPVLNDNLSFVFGGRYTRDDRSATRDSNSTVYYLGPIPTTPEVGASNSQSFSRFNPSFTANYQWTGDLSTYAKYATGYKSGGSDEAIAQGQFSQTYGPEDVKTYELGLKSYWMDHRLRMNVALFESKFKDMQMTFLTNPVNPAERRTINAGSAVIDGAELEIDFQPVEELMLGFSYSYLHSKLDKVEAAAGTVFDPSVNPSSPYNVGDNIKNLFTLPYTPRNSLNLMANYRFFQFDQGDLSAQLNYRWQDSQYLTSAAGEDVPGHNFYQQPAYGLVDGRLTMAVTLPRGEHASLSLWGKNLANHRYPVSLFGSGGGIAISGPAGAGTAPGYTGSTLAWNEPISFGVDVSYEY